MVEHVNIRPMCLGRKIPMEGFCEQLKLDFLWEQRGVNEKTYHIASDHDFTANIEIGRLTRYCVDAIDLGFVGLTDLSTSEIYEHFSYICWKLQQARGCHVLVTFVQLMGVDYVVFLIIKNSRIKFLEVFVDLPNGVRWFNVSIHGTGHADMMRSM
jgi:hypothetical protein